MFYFEFGGVYLIGAVISGFIYALNDDNSHNWSNEYRPGEDEIPSHVMCGLCMLFWPLVLTAFIIFGIGWGFFKGFPLMLGHGAHKTREAVGVEERPQLMGPGTTPSSRQIKAPSHESAESYVVIPADVDTGMI